MRITRKYPIAFLLTTLGTALAIFFLLLQILRTSIEKEITKRGTSLAESFALANGPLVLRLPAAEETGRLQYNVNALGNDPDVLNARVADHNGVIHASMDTREIGSRMPQFFTDASAPPMFADPANQAYHFRAHILYGGVNIGTFVLTLSSLPLEAALRQARNRALLFTGGIALMMSIFAMLFVRHQIRPIAAISAKLQAIAKGDFSERVPEGRNDELGELAAAFNLMVRRTQLFMHYVDKLIVERLIADESLTKPGGRMHDIAVVFGDMRGFTAMSNRRTADEIVSIINTYFHLYIECIAHMRGTVDKTIGDAIMAVFERGEQEDFEGHKRRGMLTLAYMKAACRVLNIFLRQRAAAGEALAIEPCEFGFAMAAGKALIGNIGSWRRMDYTVCGRIVNLAARLEGLTKNGEVIVDNFTRLGCSDLVKTEALPAVQPKGFTEAEKVTPHRLVTVTEDEAHKLRILMKRIFTYSFVREKLMPASLPVGEQQPWCNAAELQLIEIIAETPIEELFWRVDPRTGAPVDVPVPLVATRRP